MEEGCSISERFTVTVAPLKEAYSSFKFVHTWVVGTESKEVYQMTPHRYEIDNTDVLWPKYVGEDKKTRWLTEYVCLDTLAKKYPEDAFIKRCLDEKLRYEDSEKAEDFGSETGLLPPKTEMQRFLKRQEIVKFITNPIDGRKSILTRILTPAKINTKVKRVGFLKFEDEHYIVPL